MFLILFIVLLVAWLLGFFAFHVAGGLIHLLIVVAVISLIVHFVRGSRSRGVERSRAHVRRRFRWAFHYSPKYERGPSLRSKRETRWIETAKQAPLVSADGIVV
jgi:hypothetical protein